MARRKLASATKDGDRLEMLQLLAGMLAKRLDQGVDDKSLASVAKQYRDTLREIEELKGANGGGDEEIDELMQARAAKGRPGAVRERRNSG
jgi:hypothetical protein